VANSEVDAQTEWAYRLLESLVEAGVRQAVISPGSRSTPLTWAALETPGLSCRCLIDERSAAFFALGQARITGAPSLLICTSGTALANYYPAVIEAAQSGLPLIVLSADRPFELMDCGAQQTIDQTRLFGDYALFRELGGAAATEDALLALRRSARQAVERAVQREPGPIHLNFRAAKPLEPRDTATRIPLPSPGNWPKATARVTLPGAHEVEALAQVLEASSCPLLVAGATALQEAPEPSTLARFIQVSGALLVPEATSQLRFALSGDLPPAHVVDAFDWLVSDRALSSRLRPDFVLQLGDSPMSTGVQQFVKERRSRLPWALAAARGWPDPIHQSAHVVRADAGPLLDALTRRLEQRAPADSSARQLFRAANEVAWRTLDERLETGFGEAVAVRVLCASLPVGSVLAVGNSLPPRHLDRYCAAAARGIRVCAQRGASGIEGGIAGALGAASVAGSATTLLLGDIAALHDVGSLWAADAGRTHAEPFAHPVVIVVLNNGGGRIFEQLPVARQRTEHLRFWTSPHGLDLEPAARLFGVAYTRVSARAELAPALGAAYARAGVTLVEIQVEPDNALRTQSALQDALRERFAALSDGGA
jgi:2-succinyl-5-enolpyruvyl-6-hydroxy-3-cyclohexene-1-carboxylate synthase